MTAEAAIGRSGGTRLRSGGRALAKSPVPGFTRRALLGLRRALAWAARAAMLLLVLAGCAPAGGPRPIVAGTPCAGCGMRIGDLRYACEAEREGDFRVYDSIECLLRAGPVPERAWLADYDTRALHSADSLWVVQAEIPSPMGGGLAAFIDRGAASEIAAARSGRVARLGDFAPRAAAPDSAAAQP